MGKPLPGVEAAIVRPREGYGGVEVDRRADQEGELALRRGWPSMPRGYLEQDEERYRSASPATGT